jgi:hypothetical protein
MFSIFRHNIKRVISGDHCVGSMGSCFKPNTYLRNDMWLIYRILKTLEALLSSKGGCLVRSKFLLIQMNHMNRGSDYHPQTNSC